MKKKRQRVLKRERGDLLGKSQGRRRRRRRECVEMSPSKSLNVKKEEYDVREGSMCIWNFKICGKSTTIESLKIKVGYGEGIRRMMSGHKLIDYSCNFVSGFILSVRRESLN